MAVKREDQEFEALLNDKRHKEITASLKCIVDVLSAKGNIDIAQVIDQQARSLQSVLDAIKSMPAPNVHVEQKTEDLKNIIQEVLRGFSELKKSIDTKSTWEFTISRQGNGYIEKVIAKQL